MYRLYVLKLNISSFPPPVYHVCMRLIAKEGTDCFYIRGFVLYLVLESGTSDLFVLLIRVEYIHYILYLPFLLLVPYIDLILSILSVWYQSRTSTSNSRTTIKGVPNHQIPPRHLTTSTIK